MPNIKNRNTLTGKETVKDQIKFPEVEDIFYAPESAEKKEEITERAGATEIARKIDQSSAVSADAMPTALAPVQAIAKSPLLVEIEKIMEENMQEIYRQIPDEAKQKFRIEGERTAGEIQTLMRNFKATTKKVLELIRNWLKLIPGINRYFLEQEAKIKADRIIAIQLSRFQKK